MSNLATWFADHFLRARQQRREAEALIAENDARAVEIQTDLDRWVSDQGHRLDAVLRGIVNSARNQLYAGSLRSSLEEPGGLSWPEATR